MNKRIYACYSLSHISLLEEHFLPSIPDGFDVVLRKHPQVCETGSYASPNWGAATKNKIPFILEAIERENEPFVFSDVDIRFYDFTPSDLENEMKSGTGGQKPHVKCQADDTSYCTGFMLINPSTFTHHLFELVLDNCERFTDDQHTFNNFVLPSLKDRTGIYMLSKRYWNIGPNCPNWDSIVPPHNIAIHHGNWVIGIENKMKLLNSVLSKVGQRQS